MERIEIDLGNGFAFVSPKEASIAELCGLFGVVVEMIIRGTNAFDGKEEQTRAVFNEIIDEAYEQVRKEMN